MVAWWGLYRVGGGGEVDGIVDRGNTGPLPPLARSATAAAASRQNSRPLQTTAKSSAARPSRAGPASTSVVRVGSGTMMGRAPAARAVGGRHCAGHVNTGANQRVLSTFARRGDGAEGNRSGRKRQWTVPSRAAGAPSVRRPVAERCARGKFGAHQLPPGQRCPRRGQRPAAHAEGKHTGVLRLLRDQVQPDDGVGPPLGCTTMCSNRSAVRATDQTRVSIPASSTAPGGPFRWTWMRYTPRLWQPRRAPHQRPAGTVGVRPARLVSEKVKRLTGLPPLLIQAGSHEIVFDDATGWPRRP